MIILDTNVISEAMRTEPDARVARWMMAQIQSRLYLTSIVEAEIRYGVALLPEGKRRQSLTALSAAILADLQDRILPFDSRSAIAYAKIAADRRSVGEPLALFDGLIAAIALAHGATIATRNLVDFEGCGVALVDPWNA